MTSCVVGSTVQSGQIDVLRRKFEDLVYFTTLMLRFGFFKTL